MYIYECTHTRSNKYSTKYVSTVCVRVGVRVLLVLGDLILFSSRHLEARLRKPGRVSWPLEPTTHPCPWEPGAVRVYWGLCSFGIKQRLPCNENSFIWHVLCLIGQFLMLPSGIYFCFCFMIPTDYYKVSLVSLRDISHLLSNKLRHQSCRQDLANGIGRRWLILH